MLYVLEFDIPINNYSYKNFKEKRLCKYQVKQKNCFKSKRKKTRST